MAKKPTNMDRALILQIVDDAFDRKAWHGPNLRGAIRRVDEKQAAWRPKPGRHNIAEIVVHCAYWKYAVRRRIRGDKRGSFPMKGSNWFTLPERLTKATWKAYVSMLVEEHSLLRTAIEQASPKSLYVGGKAGQTMAGHIHGAALHDVYHTGQIQMLKALYKTKNRSSQ